MEDLFESIETSGTVVQPELRLWAGVLQQGIKDAFHGTKHQQANALEWITSGRNELNTFVGICQLLDVEPSAIREYIFNREEVKTVTRMYRSNIIH